MRVCVEGCAFEVLFNAEEGGATLYCRGFMEFRASGGSLSRLRRMKVRTMGLKVIILEVGRGVGFSGVFLQSLSF